MRLSRALWFAVIAAVFAVPLFVGLDLVDMENDEAIYAYAVDSILESGDWLNPRASPDPTIVFVEKPPLKFWIVALPIRLGLFPNTEFGQRVWDALFGGVAFLYVFAIGRRMAGPLCGIVALLVLYSFHPLLFTHGLRGNNMEAALLLSYCGGIYHYLRWAEAPSRRAAWRHAAAVGGYVFLGFMTKFVAVAFLPIILAAASLELAEVRGRLRRDWRVWLLVAAGVILLAAPWFVYQIWRTGMHFVHVIVGTHVVQRFNQWLDPAHVRPWHFYFVDLYGQMIRTDTFWWAVAGAVLMQVRVLRQRWLDGTATLYWFLVPFVLMSLGTSKLRHYSYPFLPPVALAAGYAMAWLQTTVWALASDQPPAWAQRLLDSPRVAGVRDRLAAWRQAGQARLAAGPRGPWQPAWRVVRVLLTIAAAAYLFLAVTALLGWSRVTLFGMVVNRHPSVIKHSLAAIGLAWLAGRGRLGVRAAVVLVLLSLAPVALYQRRLVETQIERRPLQQARNCILAVNEGLRRAGRPVPPAFVYVPNKYYQHYYFYYVRPLGWDVNEEVSDDKLQRLFYEPETARPVLMPRERFEAYLAAVGATEAMAVPRVPINEYMLLFTPGPYAGCATE